jgi:hypothetical protein
VSNTMHTPKIEDCIAFPSILLYIVYNGRIVGKGYGMKCGAIGNSLWNNHWEHDGNPKSKINLAPCFHSALSPFTIYIHRSWTVAKQYGTKLKVLLGTSQGNTLGTWGTWWEHIGQSLLIGCMEFLFPKLFVTIFNLVKYPHYKLGWFTSW